MTAHKSNSRPWPATTVELWSPDKIHPYPDHPYSHTAEDVAVLASSMEKWGVTSAILIDETGEIIFGHCRFRAITKLGYDEIPVMIARGWSEEDKRACRVADNQIAARAKPNDFLVSELEALLASGFDMDLLGFEADSLEGLLASLPAEGVTDPDAIPPAAKETVTQPGDTWLLGGHRIHCGDCTDAAAVAQAMGDLQPQLMLTDPPYGVDYDPTWREKYHGGKAVPSRGKVLNDDRADWREAWEHFPGDVAYIWHSAIHANIVAESLHASGFAIRAQIIWAKQHFAFGRGDYHWQHEPCFYVVRKGKTSHWNGDRKQSTLWDVPNNGAVGNGASETVWGHGTQKPVELMRRSIVNNSRPGDCIYDPFSGTGSTLIAAEMTGRLCVGLELSPQYVDVIVKRWQAFTGKAAILESSGQSLAAMEANRLAAVARSPVAAGA